MRSSVWVLAIGLLACAAEEGEPYAPAVDGLPGELFAGATVELTLEPAPELEAALTVHVDGAAVESVRDAGVLRFTIPDTIDGATEIALKAEGVAIWSDSAQVLGFVESREASTWVGRDFWNLVTIDLAGVTYVWGAVAGDGLGRLTPSTGEVTILPALLSTNALRVPGPTSVPGRWIVAPPEAVAVDSLELWQLAPFVSKVGRIPRMGIGRQAGEVGPGVWLITNHHGLLTVDRNNLTIPYSAFSDYEESQVVFRSPSGDRTTISFHGGILGTPVFGPDGVPAYHVTGMRAVRGVAFSVDSARMVLVGYGQDFHWLLMEVELDDGTVVDSVPLADHPRAVALDPWGRTYVLTAGPGGRPFVDIYQRGGYSRLGRMQAPAAARVCASGCLDAVLAFDLIAGRLFAVDAADPPLVGGTGNGIWAFRVPSGPPTPTEAVPLP